MHEWLMNPTTSIRKSLVQITGVTISTVFLGVDHGLGPSEDGAPYKPILHETMVFGGPDDQYQVRASDYDTAIENHEEILNREIRRCKKIVYKYYLGAKFGRVIARCLCTRELHEDS